MRRYPAINLRKLDAACSEVAAFLRLAEGEPLSPELIRRLLKGASYAADYNIPPVNFEQTLAQYSGKVLNASWRKLLARQIAARRDELMVRPLLPFDRPTRPEWVPIEILSLEETVWNETKSGHQLTFFCLAGTPAGYTLKRKFPTRWLAWLAYQIGFSRRVMYQDDPQVFIGMRVWAHIAPSTDPSQTMDIVDWDVSSAMKKHNRIIAYRRMRFDLRPSLTRDGDPGSGACPYDLDCYCRECTHTSASCEASYNRTV
jgi:hypothetical protein